MTELAQGQVARAGAALQRYTAAWRWHFFAGVFVVPFLLVLATTGLIMLYYNTVQTPLGEQLYVAAGESATTSPAEQLAAAQAALPGSTAALYVPAAAADRPVQFELLQAGSTYAVDIDPYTNRVLRGVDKNGTLYALAHRIHGTLLWWLRRPTRAGWLPTPPRVAALPLRSGLTVLLLALGIVFPLLGATLVAGLLVYALIGRYRQ